MPSVEWYYAREGKQSGPVSPAELRQLAVAGGLQPEDLVWREGMGEWAAARNVKGLFDGVAGQTDGSSGDVAPAGSVAEMELSAPSPVAGTASISEPWMRHVFDMLLDGVRGQFTAHFVDTTTQLFVRVGHYALYLAMVASLVFGLSVGVKTESVRFMLPGLVYALVFAVLQYIAGRCWEALERLNRKSSGTVASKAFLDCFALLSILASVALLLDVSYRAVDSGEYTGILFGLLIFVLFEYLAFISLSPQTMHLRVVAADRASEEAVGILSFLLKAMLRLAPVAFGAGVVYGTLLILEASFGLCLGREVVLVQLAADDAWVQTTYFAATPFVAYWVFLIFHLTIDVIRSVLSLPERS